jgi:hypothetical protein
MTEEFAWRAALASAIIEGKGGEEIPPSEAGRVLALDTSGKFLKLPSHFAEFAQVGSHDLHIGFLYFVVRRCVACHLRCVAVLRSSLCPTHDLVDYSDYALLTTPPEEAVKLEAVESSPWFPLGARTFYRGYATNTTVEIVKKSTVNNAWCFICHFLFLFAHIVLLLMFFPHTPNDALTSV